MKPKLLITLGCSWTEGIGCYEPQMNYNTNELISPIQITNLREKYYKYNSKNFHKYSWPNIVGRKLGFDKVINLGMGGSSNSSHIKILFNYLEKKKLDNYDVLVLWLMTEPTRFSFYVNCNIKSYQPSYPKSSQIAVEYLKEIGRLDLDPILEQIFYIKTLENFCENNSFGCILSSWHETFTILHELYKTKNYLYPNVKLMIPPFDKDENGYLINYSFCSHPNKNGYEWIANEMVNGIKENHPKWYSGYENENIDWEWIDYTKVTPNII